jgi:hypothetical protein
MKEPSHHLLLDTAPNLGPLICRWENNKFENGWYKRVRILEFRKFLFQQFLNWSSSQQDMSGPILGDLSNNRWSWETITELIPFHDELAFLLRTLSINVSFMIYCGSLSLSIYLSLSRTHTEKGALFFYFYIFLLLYRCTQHDCDTTQVRWPLSCLAIIALQGPLFSFLFFKLRRLCWFWMAFGRLNRKENSQWLMLVSGRKALKHGCTSFLLS